MTDIVASTALVCSIGDEAFAEVMDNHDQILLEQLRRRGGELVRNQGDGLLVAFTTAGAAVGWAVEATSEVAQLLGLDIRVGAHIGPVRVRQAGYAGLALHVVSRLGSMAEGGELLATKVFFDESGIRPTDRPYEVVLRGTRRPSAVVSMRIDFGRPYANSGEYRGADDLGQRCPAG